MMRTLSRVLAILGIPSLVVLGWSAVTPTSNPTPKAGAPQAIPLWKSVTVHVTDGLTGAPIAGAPVQRIGDPYLGTTNSDGAVTLHRIPQTTQSVRLWCTPDGYSPGFGEIAVPRRMNDAVLMPIPKDRLTTGMIRAATGGQFVLSGTVGSNPDEQFYMEIDVPPGALEEDAAISLSPYPVWAAGTQGIAEDGFPLGKFHCTLRDASGAEIVGQFLLPVTFKIRSWMIPTPAEYDDLDPAWAELYRYDYTTHEFAPEPTTFWVDTQNDLLVLEVMRLSCFAFELQWKTGADYAGLWDWLFSDDDEEDQPPVMPPPPDISHTDELICLDNPPMIQAIVECGVIVGGHQQCGQTAGEALTTSAGLEAELTKKFGAKANVVLAEVSAEISASLKFSASGSLTATSTRDVGGGWDSGDRATQSNCYDGTISGILIKKVVHLKVGSFELGTVEVPWAYRPVRDLTWDASCDGCADLPTGMPITDEDPCAEE